MSLRKNSEIKFIQGGEGTKIKQYFHPHNTLNGISYSIAQFTLEPGKKSKLHKMSSSEIYYILEGSNYILFSRFNIIESRIECCGFPASGRTGHQNKSIRVADNFLIFC